MTFMNANDFHALMNNLFLLISVYKIEMRETEKSIKTCVTFVRHMNSEHMKIEKRKKRRNVSTARLNRDHQLWPEVDFCE